MSQPARRVYWPYDELTATPESAAQGVVQLQTPWISLETQIAREHRELVRDLLGKLNAGALSAADLAAVSGLLAPFASYPIAYILPRGATFGTDVHAPAALEHATLDPRSLLAKLIQSVPSAPLAGVVAERALRTEWTWDADAALEFSRVAGGFDPLTLFSVGRRYHLLESIEANLTDALFDAVHARRENENEFREAAALLLRQNHHITLNCERGLRQALPIAGAADHEILEFIAAESGHDRLLGAAIRAQGFEVGDVPVLDCVHVLMDLFAAIAGTNLVAFAMMIDIFERTSYREEDPFADVLRAGGATKAASFIERHREINDEGEHENVALDFLSSLGPIDETVAREALKLAELVTQVLHRIAPEALERLGAKA